MEGVELEIRPAALKAIARMGILGDAHGLYPRLSARENIIYFGRLQGMTPDAANARAEELARLLDMPAADLKKRLDSNPNFVWLRRKVEDNVAQQVAALKIKGVYELREARRQYPEGESAAHIVGFTNIEDEGQEGIELAYQKQLAGRDGSRHVIKDRLGRPVEAVGDTIPAVDGQSIRLSVDAKIQFYAYQRIRDAVIAHKAKAGSVVVIDVQSGEVTEFHSDELERLKGRPLTAEEAAFLAEVQGRPAE